MNRRILIQGFVVFVLGLVLTHQLLQHRVSVTCVSVNSAANPTTQHTSDLSITEAWIGLGKFSSNPRVLQVEVEKPVGIHVATENALDIAIQQRLQIMGQTPSPYAQAFRISAFLFWYILPLGIAVWYMMHMQKKHRTQSLKNLCNACGYSLVNLPTNQCPECGNKN